MTEETNHSASTNSRRNFIKNSALAAAGFMIVPRHVLGGKGFLAPSDRLYVAGVGVGGKGQSNLNNIYKGGKADIAFLCDVDDRRAAASVKNFPKAKYLKIIGKCLIRKAAILMLLSCLHQIITML